jgi:hypothetical protein
MGRDMKRLLILGSTGSIGTQALDVIGDEFELVGLSAGLPCPAYRRGRIRSPSGSSHAASQAYSVRDAIVLRSSLCSSFRNVTLHNINYE